MTTRATPQASEHTGASDPHLGSEHPTPDNTRHRHETGDNRAEIIDSLANVLGTLVQALDRPPTPPETTPDPPAPPAPRQDPDQAPLDPGREPMSLPADIAESIPDDVPEGGLAYEFAISRLAHLHCPDCVLEQVTIVLDDLGGQAHARHASAVTPPSTIG